MKVENFYGASGLDRADERRADEAWLQQQLVASSTRFWPLKELKHAVQRENSEPLHLSGQRGAELVANGALPVLLGLDDVGSAHFALELGDADLEEGEAVAFRDLRAFGLHLDRFTGAVLAYARGMLHWHTRHGFCPVCGSATQATEAGHRRRCSSDTCAAIQFPRIDPAVIMLVSCGDYCLLGRQAIWPPGMHSVLAGFVEPGESLEETVAREVYEESGVRVSNVRYHSSQAWPFPSSIMLGFMAEAASLELGEVSGELEFAAWYHRDQLMESPEDETFRLPRRDSIARRLVDEWLGLDWVGPG